MLFCSIGDIIGGILAEDTIAGNLGVKPYLNWGASVSIAIVVKVSEGLVLAADSAATITGRIGEQAGVLKTYYNAKKLFQVGDFPIGVLTWGQAFIGLRTIESLVREWEHQHNWQSQEALMDAPAEGYAVRTCAESLHQFLVSVYAEEYKDRSKEESEKKGLGVVVAGYSKSAFFPEIWRFVLPFDDKVHNQRPDIDGKPQFGASWFGATDAIIRLHWGRDERAIGIISEKFSLPEDAVREALAPLEYAIPFAVMPLQDAIEYARYLVNVVIGRFRFVVGSELCGGQVDIAAITQEMFSWITLKELRLETGG